MVIKRGTFGLLKLYSDPNAVSSRRQRTHGAHRALSTSPALLRMTPGSEDNIRILLDTVRGHCCCIGDFICCPCAPETPPPCRGFLCGESFEQVDSALKQSISSSTRSAADAEVPKMTEQESIVMSSISPVLSRGAKYEIVTILNPGGTEYSQAAARACCSVPTRLDAKISGLGDTTLAHPVASINGQSGRHSLGMDSTVRYASDVTAPFPVPTRPIRQCYIYHSPRQSLS